MKVAQSYLGRALFCGLAVWLYLIGSPPANGQEKTGLGDIKVKHVKFAARQLTMAEMIAVLGEQSGCAIVADDEPLKKRAEINVDGTVQEALNQIAQAFDYSWTLSRQNVVLMHKAFKALRERPQMNLAEMRQMAQRAVVALKVFPCDPDPLICYTQANQLFKMFSPEQSAQLQQGKHLGAKDLSVDQHSLLQRIITNGVLGGALRQWQSLLDTLNAVPEGSVVYTENEPEYYLWFLPTKPDARVIITGGRKKETQP